MTDSRGIKRLNGRRSCPGARNRSASSDADVGRKRQCRLGATEDDRRCDWHGPACLNHCRDCGAQPAWGGETPTRSGLTCSRASIRPTATGSARHSTRRAAVRALTRSSSASWSRTRCDGSPAGATATIRVPAGARCSASSSMPRPQGRGIRRRAARRRDVPSRQEPPGDRGRSDGDHVALVPDNGGHGPSTHRPVDRARPGS